MVSGGGVGSHVDAGRRNIHVDLPPLLVDVARRQRRRDAVRDVGVVAVDLIALNLLKLRRHTARTPRTACVGTAACMGTAARVGAAACGHSSVRHSSAAASFGGAHWPLGRSGPFQARASRVRARVRGVAWVLLTPCARVPVCASVEWLTARSANS
eukprot:6665975-Prymnesium_polylepis.1